MEELTLDQQKALILARARRRRAEAEQQQAPDFADVQSGSSNSIPDSRIPRGIGPEQMTNLKPMDARDFKGLLGLDRNASVPSPQQAILQQLNPLNTAMQGVNTAKAIGSSIVNAPSNLMSGEPNKIMQGLAGIAGAVPIAEGVSGALKGSLPNAARAGAKFDVVDAAAKDVPLNLALPDEIVARAKELASRGGKLPKVLSDYVKNRAAASEAQTPMTYSEGRDFAKNAGALSSREATRINAPMHRQVSKFYDAMKNTNREAAAKVGLGQQYDEAMAEYAKAMSQEAKLDWAKKWAKRGIAVYVLGKAAGAALDFSK